MFLLSKAFGIYMCIETRKEIHHSVEALCLWMLELPIAAVLGPGRRSQLFLCLVGLRAVSSLLSVSAAFLSARVVCSCVPRGHLSGLPSRPPSSVEPFFQPSVSSLFTSSLGPVSLPASCPLAFLTWVFGVHIFIRL